MKSKKQQAEQLYQIYLSKIEKMLGHNSTTYLSELNGIAKKLLGIKYKGTFPSDRIPRLSDLSSYAVINLDRSDQAGSHWIAISKKPNSNECLVYDSFGRDYKKIIPNLLEHHKNYKIQNTERDVEQKLITQKNCGQRCLAFLCVIHELGYSFGKYI